MPVLTEERPSRQTVLERAERRERIATALFAGLLANGNEYDKPECGAVIAANHADALMAELDRRLSAELAEARS